MEEILNDSYEVDYYYYKIQHSNLKTVSNVQFTLTYHIYCNMLENTACLM